jgi:hypothetical protein
MTNAATVILHDAVGMRDESHGSTSSSHWDGNDRIEVVLRRVYRRRGAGGNLRSGFSNGEGNACCLLAYCRGAQIPWMSGQYCKESNGSIELLVRLESLCRDLRLKRRRHVIGDVYAC